MALMQFTDVSVAYPIYNARSQSFRNQLIRVSTGGRLAGEAGQLVTVTALDRVSFTLKDGDAIGLVGHNGAGKTTLLRTMAGIYHPVTGSIVREGSTSTIIEIGSGMDPELSGYENIIRMGLLLGSSKEEMLALTPEIEAFTELGNFLHMPVRTYSAGMTMRLMFSVVTSIKPEILLIDEMFGAGDSEFQQKATARMKSLIGAAKIFVFASHSHELIKNYCNRVFRLEHGAVTEIALADL